MRSTTRAVSRLALALTLLGAGACTSDGQAGTTTAPSNGGGSPATSTPSTVVVGTATVVPGPKNDIDKRKAVAMSACKATQEGAEASGTIDNQTDKEAEYKIQVTFTNEKATDLGNADITVKAAAKKKTEWKAVAKFQSDPKVKCVLGPIS